MLRTPHCQARDSGDPGSWWERAAAWLPQPLLATVAIAGILILSVLVITLILTIRRCALAAGG